MPFRKYVSISIFFEVIFFCENPTLFPILTFAEKQTFAVICFTFIYIILTSFIVLFHLLHLFFSFEQLFLLSFMFFSFTLESRRFDTKSIQANHKIK